MQTRRNRSGGSRVEDGLMVVWAEGGELGGVSRPWTGRGPGELYGMCLFGMAAGVPLAEVLRVMWGGGVVVRDGSGGARATMVAILSDERGRLYTRLTCSRKQQLEVFER